MSGALPRVAKGKPLSPVVPVRRNIRFYHCIRAASDFGPINYFTDILSMEFTLEGLRVQLDITTPSKTGPPLPGPTSEAIHTAITTPDMWHTLECEVHVGDVARVGDRAWSVPVVAAMSPEQQLIFHLRQTAWVVGDDIYNDCSITVGALHEDMTVDLNAYNPGEPAELYTFLARRLESMSAGNALWEFVRLEVDDREVNPPLNFMKFCASFRRRPLPDPLPDAPDVGV